MAERDTHRWQVKQALLLRTPKRRPKIKLEVPKAWYQKKRKTINIKLRQAIIDLMPLELDNNQADVILCAIFDTIVKGVERDGRVTINHFGSFYKKLRPGRWYCQTRLDKNKKLVNDGLRWVPAHYDVGWKPTKSFKLTFRDKESDGPSGTGQ